MKTFAFALTLFLSSFAAILLSAQDAENRSAGTADDDKLTQFHKNFVGEWDITGMSFDGSVPKGAKKLGSEKTRSFGEHWVVAEGELQTPAGSAMSYLLTIGYDPSKKKYLGAWICNQMPDQWVYQGTVNVEGTALTLEAEGPNPAAGGKLTKFRDVHEFKDDGNRVVTSYALGEDGKWVSYATAYYQRKK